jgi:hypothetical protein
VTLGAQGNGIAVDSAGNAYVTGNTVAVTFPTTPGAFQTSFGGGSCGTPPNTFACSDAFVLKLNPAGSELVYSTFLGGRGDDSGNSIAVDAAGNAYVTGSTASTNFPTVAPLQPVFAGGTCGLAPNTFQCAEAFVAKLNSTGSALLYSTYLGGSAGDLGSGIAVDTSGNAYITGSTDSTNFPTVSPLQAVPGGSGDAFVAKLNAAGSALLYSTYLGGNFADSGSGIAVDSSGNAYVTGSTSSTNFPTANPLHAAPGGSGDAFVAKLNATGSALMYSTYLGGSGIDQGSGIAVDSSGNAYITGSTDSRNFPTVNSIQAVFSGDTCLNTADSSPCFDVFVAKLNAAGSALAYSTYLNNRS